MKNPKKMRDLIGSSVVLALVVGAITCPLPAEGHAAGISLSGFGTATIDGILSPGEWDGAGRVDFPVNIPGGGTTPGTVFAMNDASNLYLAIRFARTIVDPGNTAAFEFDNKHLGGTTRSEGDAVFLINPSIGSFDEYRTFLPPCPSGALCGLLDTATGGTNDLAGAFFNNGASTVYEFSHPLKSGDVAHDFSVSPGDTLGFTLLIRMIGLGGIADTFFPGNICCSNTFGDIVIASPIPVPEVPEPATLWLLGSGLAALAGIAWRGASRK